MPEAMLRYPDISPERQTDARGTDGQKP